MDYQSQTATWEQLERAALAIYRCAYEMELAGFDGCSRHANCLMMMVGWARNGSWFAYDRARYIASRIIAGEYQK